LLTAFVGEAVGAVRGLERLLGAGQLPWLQRAWEWLQLHAPGQQRSDLSTLARDAAERVAAYLASRAGAVLRNIAVFLFDLVVTLFAMFYLFRDAGSLLSGLRRILPFEPAHREQMIREARELIFASVTSSLIVSGVHGLLGGVAFAVLHVSAAVFWGVMMAFFALLPVVGAWMIWLPAAIWLMVNGAVARGIVLLALAGGVAGVVDHFLRPMLISGKTRLSGLLVFVSVLGGIAVFGMLGVVLGPIVVAAAASVLEVYTQSEEGIAGKSPYRPDPVGTP
jgi:predicted PurR-regulated permease PerM